MFRGPRRKEPLYLPIKRELLFNIEHGLWPIGHKLPGEKELQTKYDVSRGTVRQALADLEAEGFISRRAAKGTVVIRQTRQFEHTTRGISSFTDQMIQAGLVPATRVLSAQVLLVEEAPPAVQQGFGLPAKAEVVQITRLRLGNDIPLTLHRTFLRPEWCPDILQANLDHLFTLYAERYGTQLVAAEETLYIAGASREEADLLQVEPGAPVVHRTRVSFDEQEQPFEVLLAVDRGTRFFYRYLIFTDRTSIPTPVERLWEGSDQPAGGKQS